MATYYTLLTNYGTQQFAAAVANNRPLTVTHFAVGDGNGRAITPNATRTTLFKEVYRAAASRISLDPKNDKQIIFELTIPENVGGFTIREMGLFDSSGKMLAHANCPENYKPQLSEGAGKLQVLRMVLKISHKDAVTLTIDNSTIWATVGQTTPKTITATSKNQLASDGHTHEIAKASTTQAGLVQLTNDTGLDSEVLALTAKAGKALAQAAANAQVTANNKWTAVDATTARKGIVQLNSAINSTSTSQAATPRAVKQAYDLANGKVSKAGDTITGNFIIDKTAKNEWSAIYLNSKKGNYRFEANLDDDDNRLNIVHQVGTTQKYLRFRKFKNDDFIAYEDWVKGGFAPIHNPSHTGTILGNYRLVIDRNEAEFTPYINLKDSSVDVSKAVSKVKAVGDIHTLIKNGTSERIISTLRTNIQTDKNTTGHYGVADSAGNMRWAWSAFGKTGNLAIGKTADDGTHKLQVAGSIHATGQTILNSPTAIVRFQNNGTNYGYVGFPASNSKNIRFSSNLWGNSYLELQESKIVAGQALYEGGNRVQHHGQRYAEVATASGVLSGLSVNLNGTWFGRVESSDDKRWKFIHNGDRAYWLPRNTSNQDKTIATTDDVNTRLPLTGGTLTGNFILNNNGNYPRIQFKAGDNSLLTLHSVEANAQQHIATLSKENVSGERIGHLWFPKRVNETIATTADVQNALNVANGKANASHTHTYNQISNFAAGVTAQFNTNTGTLGWIKMPTGIIMQWGFVTENVNPGEISKTVKFNLKFPTRCLYVGFTRLMARHSINGDGGVLLISKSTTEFEVSLQAFASNTLDLRGFEWFAIGV